MCWSCELARALRQKGTPQAILHYALAQGQELWRARTHPLVVDAYLSVRAAVTKDPGAAAAFKEVMHAETARAAGCIVPDPDVDAEGYANVVGTWAFKMQLHGIEEAAAGASYDYTRRTIEGALRFIRNDKHAMIRSVQCALEARNEARRNPPICMVSTHPPGPDARGWVPSSPAEA